MGRTIVNLDDKQNTAEITVAGKTWEISRAVLKMKEMYGKYVTAAAEYINKINSEDDQEKINELTTDYAYRKIEMLNCMVEKLLSDNGYDFDGQWWVDNIEDYNVMETFVVEAIKKDAPEESKKKATMES